MNASAVCYTIVHDDLVDQPGVQDLRNALQKGSDEVKLETMRRIIVGTLNGQSYVRGSPQLYLQTPQCDNCSSANSLTSIQQPQLLMPIIQYVMPSRNKQIKKMLHFYWE